MGFNVEGGVGGGQAHAFAEKPEGHQCGRLTRIIKVCSNEDV